MRTKKVFVLAVLLVSVSLLGSGAQSGAAPRTQDATPTAIGRASAPDWQFAVLTYQDPYQGMLQKPDKPQSGMRYIAAEVEITNGSDQAALNFLSSDVKLEQDSGLEYRASVVIGSEPRLRGRNLNPGERARGWVWFEVSENAKVTRLTFVAPSPEFRIDVSNDGA
jgi:hypothetical protein